MYLGAGLGAYYVIQRFEIGVVALEEDNWHFGVAPEAGFLFPMGDALAIINTRFNYAFDAGEHIGGDLRDWMYWNVNVGYAYRTW